MPSIAEATWATEKFIKRFGGRDAVFDFGDDGELLAVTLRSYPFRDAEFEQMI